MQNSKIVLRDESELQDRGLLSVMLKLLNFGGIRMRQMTTRRILCWTLTDNFTKRPELPKADFRINNLIEKIELLEIVMRKIKAPIREKISTQKK